MSVRRTRPVPCRLRTDKGFFDDESIVGPEPSCARCQGLDWMGPGLEVLSEELHSPFEHLDTVFRLSQAVSFILEEEILVIDVPFVE